ncbi:hypothetical protein WJX73_009684 [Symbiochloris irregularis]|uniref:Uncharacterized protein n=1 Tax=Symbiochloris irregularis TaxID=706552 RepID=A0AAW1NNQ5_9CHLO
MLPEIESATSRNDRVFIVKALAEEQRIDGRKPFDARLRKIQIAEDNSGVTVQLGDTKVMAVITADLEEPRADGGRQREGSIRFKVDVGPTVSFAADTTRLSEDEQLITRLLQKAIRNTGVVDLEALCVSAGRKVWALAVYVTVLDHAGALVDACFLATMAALMAHRRPDATVDASTSDITVHSPDVREPVPLSLHHTPLAVTFALFKEGDDLVMDPLLKEEAAAGGQVTVVVNTAGQVCAVQQLGGLGLSLEQVMRVVRIAAGQVEDAAAQIRAALDTHSTAQLAARVRRQQGHAAHAAKAKAAAFLDVALPPLSTLASGSRI